MAARKKTWFERAIFLSWYCSKGDCTFCYMSLQKPLIKDPKKARRSREAILAEALISRLCGWKIEFLSGGYDSYSIEELAELAGQIYCITGQRQWLNVGALKKEEMKRFIPFIEGVSGAVECINPQIRKKVCPSKPLEHVIKMLYDAEKLGLKKSITIIIGLGETEEDIPSLIDFIRKHKIDKITFYALNPHKGTVFKKGPETGYYVKWIKAVRKEFPKLQIVAGSWVNRLSEVHLLLDAGADAITKFPAIKLFGTKYAMQIEEEARKAGRKFEGTLTKMPRKTSIMDAEKELRKLKIDDELKDKIKTKLDEYLREMKKS